MRPTTRVLHGLSDVHRLQRFVDTLEYNQGDRLSPMDVLRERRADCLESAAFACMALKHNDVPAFLIDLRSVRDEDHILCVAKTSTGYGSVAGSKFLGLRGRNPVYSSVRELVMSYFEHYFNFYGEFTLREFSVPFDPDERYADWRENKETMHRIEQDIDGIEHYRIMADSRLPQVSELKFWREVIVMPEGTRVGKRYEAKRPEGHGR